MTTTSVVRNRPLIFRYCPIIELLRSAVIIGGVIICGSCGHYPVRKKLFQGGLFCPLLHSNLVELERGPLGMRKRAFKITRRWDLRDGERENRWLSTIWTPPSHSFTCPLYRNTDILSAFKLDLSQLFQIRIRSFVTLSQRRLIPSPHHASTKHILRLLLTRCFFLLNASKRNPAENEPCSSHHRRRNPGYASVSPFSRSIIVHLLDILNYDAIPTIDSTKEISYSVRSICFRNQTNNAAPREWRRMRKQEAGKKEWLR